MFISSFESDEIYEKSDKIYSFRNFFENCFISNKTQEKIQLVEENDILIIKSTWNIVFKNFSLNSYIHINLDSIRF